MIIFDDDRKRYPIYLDGQLSLSRRANCKCRFLLTRRANASAILCGYHVQMSLVPGSTAQTISSRTHHFLSFILISDMSPPTSTISTAPVAGRKPQCICARFTFSVRSVEKKKKNERHFHREGNRAPTQLFQLPIELSLPSPNEHERSINSVSFGFSS